MAAAVSPMARRARRSSAASPAGIHVLSDVDRMLHEPARTIIVALLHPLECADFRFLHGETGLTKGNLSSHLSKLESAGYVGIEKTFEGKMPRTLYSLTHEGRKAFDRYRDQLRQAVRSMPT